MNSGECSKDYLCQSVPKPKHVGRQNEPASFQKDSESLEESKVKTKLLKLWNNVKYGWTVKLKTNFSKDSPVWLLGRCYTYKLTEDSNFAASRGTCTEAEGIEEFKLDFTSRLWLTYRREFPLLNGSNFTTDCGWGCMLRSGQMLLAQALVCHLLGREWRWCENQAVRSSQSFKEDCLHRKIIKWFGDNPSITSPFSIHALVSLGESSGKHPGDWYGPGSVAHLIRKAVEQAAVESEDFKEIRVYVAQDCAVYIQDVLDHCVDSNNSAHDGKSLWKALILLVPVRLGIEKLNYIYGPCLTALLQLETCIGIIGGRPKHALYFIGFQDDKLIHLDPHYCQEVVDVWQPNFPLTSFHCRSPRKMNLTRMDPSCCIGFYCRTQNDFKNFVEASRPLLRPATETTNYPIFVFSDGRSTDNLPMKCVIPDFANELGDSESYKSDDELGTEEFEFL